MEVKYLCIIYVVMLKLISDVSGHYLVATAHNDRHH